MSPRIKLLTLALVALALVESAMALVGPRRATPPGDWEAAAALIRPEYKPGDLVVVAPAWADPVARQALGDLIPVDVAARPDADRFARIWAVTIRGATPSEVAGLTPKSTRTAGKVTVRFYEKPAAEVLYDFTARFAAAHVSTVQGADERPCAPDPGAFVPGIVRCSPSQVGPRVLEVEYLPRKALLVPPEPGRTTRLAWTDVPGGTLVLYLGLHDFNNRKYADGPVDVVVFADDKELLRHRYLQTEGWKRFDLPLAAGTHAVRFEVSAPNVDRRTLALHAEVRK